MHDQQSSSTSSTGTGGGELQLQQTQLQQTQQHVSSVAARLKRTMPMPQQQIHGGPMDATLDQPSCLAISQPGSHVSPVQSGPPSTQIQLSPIDTDIVRLLGQYLIDLGLQEAANKLVWESGVVLEAPAASKLRLHVLTAQWDLTLLDLKQLATHLRRPEHLVEMKFMLLEQKYLELLHRRNIVDAVNVLRCELSPLGVSTQRVHQLSSFLMLHNPNELKSAAQWTGDGATGRQNLLDRLQRYLPAEVMLPPRRLRTLLAQAARWQEAKCKLHGGGVHLQDEMPGVSHGAGAMDSSSSGLGVDGLQRSSILYDHVCTRSELPNRVTQTLTDHMDEVWFCAFSHDSKFLATGGKEQHTSAGPQLRRHSTLSGHQGGAAFFAWSPDDQHLAVCQGEDNCSEVKIWSIKDGKVRGRVRGNSDDQLQAVAWMPDGRRLVCGGIKGAFFTCDLDGATLDTWEGIRVRALLATRRHGVLALDTHNRVRRYCFDTLSSETLFVEGRPEIDPVITLSISSCERYLLCVTKGQGIHLWDIGCGMLLRRYTGPVKIVDFVVYACFGGVDQQFVAVGGQGVLWLWDNIPIVGLLCDEVYRIYILLYRSFSTAYFDGRIHVWQRWREEPIFTLDTSNQTHLPLHGASASVNCVAWATPIPSMSLLVSAGDDGAVRLWTAEQAPDAGHSDAVTPTAEGGRQTHRGSEATLFDGARAASS